MINKNNYGVIVVAAYPFPNGYAATNRIISYLRGLNEFGLRTKYFCIRPTEHFNKTVNYKTCGNFSGIEYEYTSKTTQWSNNIIKKLYQSVLGLVNLLAFFLFSIECESYKYVIVSIDNIFINIPILIICKLKKKVTIIIVDEYPEVIRDQISIYKWFPILKYIEIKYGYYLFDGVITMTYALKEFFIDKVSDPQKIFVMPMTVEIERFENKNHSRPVQFPYVAYVGNLVSGKDGVEIAIEAFAHVHKKLPQYKLIVIGSTKNNNSFDLLKSKVETLSIENEIIFTGHLIRDEIPPYLCYADLLILSRPDTLRSRGGFPTKLGEYLASGKAVVVTAVGEIPMYLTDNVNVYFSEPNNSQKFAERMLDALLDLQRANEIGLKGKDIALTVFNYKVQSKRLVEYLESF